MSKRYTQEEKAHALDLMVDQEAAQVSETTGIPVVTLRRWKQQHDEQRFARLLAQLEDLHEKLVHNAVQLARRMAEVMDDAPLNQLSSALGVVIDRYLKVDEHLSETVKRTGEQIVRFEYRHPDGSIHESPPWAEEDHEHEDALSGGGVWPAVREDGAGHDNNPRESDDGRPYMVASPYVYDGESGMEGDEDRPYRYMGLD